MKSSTKTKSHNRPITKTHAGKGGKKSNAPHRKMSPELKGVNRDNTLASWVGGMTSRKTVSRGNTLADWVRDPS